MMDGVDGASRGEAGAAAVVTSGHLFIKGHTHKLLSCLSWGTWCCCIYSVFFFAYE
jgi:hypothetical protein